MKITTVNTQEGTQKTIDSPLTLLQYAIINSCGFFKINKAGRNKIYLTDPFTGEIIFELIGRGR
jgi:hypothetical protein